VEEEKLIILPTSVVPVVLALILITIFSFKLNIRKEKWIIEVNARKIIKIKQ